MCIDTVSLPNVSRYDDISLHLYHTLIMPQYYNMILTVAPLETNNSTTCQVTITQCYIQWSTTIL